MHSNVFSTDLLLLMLFYNVYYTTHLHGTHFQMVFDGLCTILFIIIAVHICEISDYFSPLHFNAPSAVSPEANLQMSLPSYPFVLSTVFMAP